MKANFLVACLIFLLLSCQPPADNSANEAFEKNSKVVMAYLEGFQNENLDYELLFSENYVLRGTWVGGPDSVSLQKVIEMDKMNWASNDFKLYPDPVVLLPGVNVATKEIDGSVRYYGTWEIIKPATDSTEAKSVMVPMYESFDFDEEGKILYHQTYGDFGGAMEAMEDDDDMMEDDDDMMEDDEEMM